LVSLFVFLGAEMKERDLCDWYAEEFNSGDVNAENYKESAAFLRGFYTALDASGKIDDAGTSAMERAIATLIGGASFIDICRRYKVKVRE
jgi:hypothetical protein